MDFALFFGLTNHIHSKSKNVCRFTFSIQKICEKGTIQLIHFFGCMTKNINILWFLGWFSSKTLKLSLSGHESKIWRVDLSLQLGGSYFTAEENEAFHISLPKEKILLPRKKISLPRKRFHFLGRWFRCLGGKFCCQRRWFCCPH